MLKTEHLKPVLILIFLTTLAGCHPISDADRAELKEQADEINAIFAKARSEIESLKRETLELLTHPENRKDLYPSARYQYTKKYVYYTQKDDGHCEVWASGHIPIGISERKRIKLLEHLCPFLQSAYDRNDFIDNIYLTTFDSIVIGFPYADIDAYMKPGLDLTKAWVTYWAAAKEANPEGTTLWVEPYIDAVGRGYMTSVITPIYRAGFLEGTLGIDITADLISDKFIALSDKNLMIVTDTTIPVSVNKNSYTLLKTKGLENYNYLKKEAENKAICDSLKMTNNPNFDIRTIGQWIQAPEKEATVKISGQPFCFLKEKIPEINWYLVQFKEK